MPSTSQANEHQIISLSNGYGIFIRGQRGGKWQMENSQIITNEKINPSRTGGGHTNLSKIALDIQRNNHKTEEWLRNL